MKATNIIWDTDGVDPKKLGLPEEMELPEDMVEDEEISDYLSNETGFCHKGFSLEA